MRISKKTFHCILSLAFVLVAIGVVAYATTSIGSDETEDSIPCAKEQGDGELTYIELKRTNETRSIEGDDVPVGWHTVRLALTDRKTEKVADFTTLKLADKDGAVLFTNITDYMGIVEIAYPPTKKNYIQFLLKTMLGLASGALN